MNLNHLFTEQLERLLRPSYPVYHNDQAWVSEQINGIRSVTNRGGLLRGC